jgi:recombination protein RecA
VTLKESISGIQKQFGKGSVFVLGGRESLAISVIPSGIPSLDSALRVGGFPRGRIVEIYGPESGGKSTLALTIIAMAQKAGGQAAYIDAEHAFDVDYAKVLGVDIDNLIVSQPDYGEQALEIADALVKSNEVDVVVVDSVAALVPKAELEGEMGQQSMGLQARLMSQALRKLTGSVSKSHTVFIFINQLRDKIGVMFGNPETTTGGKALKFYASVRLDIRRKEVIKEGDKPVGAITRIKAVKNKCGTPFGETELTLIYGQGFSAELDLLEVAVERGVVEKSGAWYNFGKDRLGQGREQARKFLKDNPEVKKTVFEAVQKVDK